MCVCVCVCVRVCVCNILTLFVISHPIFLFLFLFIRIKAFLPYLPFIVFYTLSRPTLTYKTSSNIGNSHYKNFAHHQNSK